VTGGDDPARPGADAGEALPGSGRDRWQSRRTGPWHRGGWQGKQPEWWPAGESWPPAGPGPPWARRRSRWPRGFGCLFAALFFVGFTGLVSIAVSAIDAAGPLGDVARVLGLVILVGGILGLAAVARTFRRTAVTLDDIVDAAERVEAGDYTARAAEGRRGPRPVRDLVRGFNAMAARLEANEAQRQRLLADVSHELRTPLAVVQGNIEAMLDGVHAADEAHLGAILDETRVLSRLVDDLRTIALSDAGALPLHREPTDLAILAADTVGSFQTTAEAAGVALSVDVADDVPLLDVDPVRIREVLANLVANALRHTPAGGTVRLAAGLVEGGRLVEATVADTGSGIEPTLVPHVFDRFAKTADSRGSGLGLAIARGLVEAHGGTISVDTEVGQGTTFRARIPLDGSAGT
jgi:two-component system sensor histidine kinase BaeS